MIDEGFRINPRCYPFKRSNLKSSFVLNPLGEASVGSMHVRLWEWDTTIFCPSKIPMKLSFGFINHTRLFLEPLLSLQYPEANRRRLGLSRRPPAYLWDSSPSAGRSGGGRMGNPQICAPACR